MKPVDLALLISSLIATHAHAFDSTLSQRTEGSAAASFWGPAITSSNCPAGQALECLESVGVYYSAISGSSLQLKEEMKSVEIDGYEFLAGAPKSLALEQVIQNIRTEIELEKLSDVEVVTLMLQAIQL